MKVDKMFHCYLHGWSSPIYICPGCTTISTSNGGASFRPIQISSNQNIETSGLIETKLHICFKKALEANGYDGTISSDEMASILEYELKELFNEVSVIPLNQET